MVVIKSHSKTRKKDSSSAIIDKSVGRRLKLRRNIIGMSQETLAKEIGVSFQQIQKYERGTNRISASRLYNISQALNVPVSFFFYDMADKAEAKKKSKVISTSDLNNAESLELVKNFLGLSLKSQKDLISLIKEIVKP